MGYTLPPLPRIPRLSTPARAAVSPQLAAFDRMQFGGYPLPLAGPPPKAEDVAPGFFRGFGRSFTHGLTEAVPEMFAGGAEVAGRLAGSESVAQAAEGFRRATPQYDPYIKGLFDIPGATVGETIGRGATYLGEQLGSGLATTVPSIGAGLAGAAAGSVIPGVGTAVGGILGAGAAALGLNVGDTYEMLRDAGVEPEQATKWALGGGIPAAVLDTLALGKLTSPIRRAIVRETVDRATKGVVGSALEGMIAEGGTEALQQAIQESAVAGATGRPLLTPEFGRSILEAGVAGGLTGGFLEGGGAGAAALARRPQAQPGQQSEAQPAEPDLFAPPPLEPELQAIDAALPNLFAGEAQPVPEMVAPPTAADVLGDQLRALGVPELWEEPERPAEIAPAEPPDVDTALAQVRQLEEGDARAQARRMIEGEVARRREAGRVAEARALTAQLDEADMLAAAERLQGERETERGRQIEAVKTIAREGGEESLLKRVVDGLGVSPSRAQKLIRNLSVFDQLTQTERNVFPQPHGDPGARGWLQRDVNRRFPTVEAAREEIARLQAGRQETAAAGPATPLPVGPAAAVEPTTPTAAALEPVSLEPTTERRAAEPELRQVVDDFVAGRGEIPREQMDEAVKLLREDLNTDPLTGLRNKRWWQAQAKAAEAHPVVVVDLKRFKPINDRYGHAVGDIVLQNASDVVRDVVPDGINAGARFGGDEFGAILWGKTDEEAQAIVEKLRQGFADRVVSFQHPETKQVIDIQGIQAHIGLARGQEAADLAQNAAAAESRKTGRGAAPAERQPGAEPGDGEVARPGLPSAAAQEPVGVPPRAPVREPEPVRAEPALQPADLEAAAVAPAEPARPEAARAEPTEPAPEDRRKPATARRPVALAAEARGVQAPEARAEGYPRGAAVSLPAREELTPASEEPRPIRKGTDFERWFAGSKVVDAEGKPLVVYHGTTSRPGTRLQPRRAVAFGEGIYFTRDPERARDYGDRTVSAYVSIQDPFDGTTPDEPTLRRLKAWRDYSDKWQFATEAFDEEPDFRAAAIRELGYDGIISSEEIVAFRPEQVRETDAAPVDAAANEAATSPQNALPEPTEPQKEAGNYKKGHVRIAGLDISIENPEGSKRREEWPALTSHYGYIRGTVGKDKDHIDVFIKPGTPQDYSGPVYVVNQTNAEGAFDEHKVMLGWDTEQQALDAYTENYTKGWDRFTGLGEFLTPDEFRRYLANADLTKPVPLSYESKKRGAKKYAEAARPRPLRERWLADRYERFGVPAENALDLARVTVAVNEALGTEWESDKGGYQYRTKEQIKASSWLAELRDALSPTYTTNEAGEREVLRPARRLSAEVLSSLDSGTVGTGTERRLSDPQRRRFVEIARGVLGKAGEAVATIAEAPATAASTSAAQAPPASAQPITIKFAIKFAKKPSAAILDVIRGAGFKWRGGDQKLWTGPNNLRTRNVAEQAAERGATVTGHEIPKPKVVEIPAEQRARIEESLPAGTKLAEAPVATPQPEKAAALAEDLRTKLRTIDDAIEGAEKRKASATDPREINRLDDSISAWERQRADMNARLRRLEAAGPAGRLVDLITSALDAGEKIDNARLTKMADEAFGGTRGQGKYGIRDAYDALEVAVNRHIAAKVQGWPRFPSMKDPSRMLDSLRKLLQRLPTQTDRTTEQVELQQFSTPPTQAFVAAHALAIRPGETVLEPSAGTGNLAMWADSAGGDVRVNEIAPRRQEMLRLQGFEPTSVDGEILDDVLPDDIKPTAVLMNPPFSSTGGRVVAHKTEFGARHVEQALKRLEPGGRLVAIVGEGMKFPDQEKAGTARSGTGAKFLDWWDGITAQYNVRANIGIPGDEYGKYGTTFPNQIIVIDKTGPTPGGAFSNRLKGIVRGRMLNLEAALDALQPIIADRASPTSQPAAAPVVAQPRGAVEPRPAGVREPARQPEAGGGGVNVRPRAERPVRPAGEARAAPAPVPASQPGPRPAQGEGLVPARPGRAEDVEPREPSVEAAPAPAEREEPIKREEETGGTFVRYVPARIDTKGLTKHPANIVEAASMAAVDPPAVTYRSKIPAKVLQEGRLSDIQYENVLYAGQRHEQILPDGARAGYFNGDGTGVGKGREIAGIIYDNFLNGRKRAVWVSIGRDLESAARQDLNDVAGENAIRIRSVNDFPMAADIDHPAGVIFTTYATLIQKGKGGQSRQQQLEKWLGKEGVLVFDEAHKAKNALAAGRAEPTQTGQAVIAIQKNLPGARVVYVSATGATDTRNMAYMTRLGLWSGIEAQQPGQIPTPAQLAAAEQARKNADKFAFPGGFNEFLNEVEAGGVGSKEMVARDLKALGMYNSRSISFEGVTYRERIHELTEPQQQMYDAAAKAWQIVLQNIDAAIGITKAGKNQRTAAMKRFWNDHQRFFRQVTTAMKMPTVIAEVEDALKTGQAAIVTLKGTGEAKTAEQVSKAEAAGQALEDLDFTPRETLAQMVESAFPTQLYEEVRNPADPTKTIRVPVERDGKPVQSKEALALKEKVLEGLSGLDLPENPLDQFVNHFGVSNVAEMTGRKRRLVRDPKSGKMKYEKRAGEGVAADKVNLHERAQFQSGKKTVAIISRAASTGISLHASLREKNQRRRRQIAAELDWSADSEMQTFGRSHRSDQASAPEYVLVSTDVGGEKRFSSTIARRLADLGALSKGQRDATGGGSLAKYNFETAEGETALVRLYDDLLAGDRESYRHKPIPGIDKKLDVLTDMGLLKESPSGGSGMDANTKRDVARFLNRILALDLRRQNALFDEFTRLFGEAVDQAKAEGTFDEGVADIKGQAIRVRGEPELIHTDETTGAQTKHVTLEVDRPTHPIPWQRASKWLDEAIDKSTAQNLHAPAGFWKNRRSGNIVLGRPAGTRTNTRTGETYQTTNTTRPNGSVDIIPQSEIQDPEKWEPLRGKEAEALWNEQHAAVPKIETKEHHIITGALLPLWGRLKAEKADRLKVIRAEADNGQRVVGVEIPRAEVGRVLQVLGVGRALETPAQIMSAVWEEGQAVALAEGLSLKKTSVHGQARLELRGAAPTRYDQLRQLGLIEERIDYKFRFFVPTDGTAVTPVLERVLKAYPPVGAAKASGLEKAANDARARLLERGKDQANDLGTAAAHGAGTFADLTIIGAHKIAQGFKAFGMWARSMVDEFGAIVGRLRENLDRLWRASSARAAAASREGPAPATSTAATPPPAGIALAPAQAPTTGPVAFSIPAERKIDELLRLFQDQYRRVQQVQTAVERQGGGRVSNLRDIFEAKPSRVEYQLEEADRRFVKPLVEELTRSKVAVEDLARYMDLLHKPDRDRVIKGRTRDQNLEGSGITAAEADRMQRQLEAKYGAAGEDGLIPKLEAGRALVRQILDHTLETRIRSGEVTQEQADNWRQRFGEHYIPQQTVEADEGPGTGVGFDVAGRPVKYAGGRYTPAFNSVAVAVAQMQTALDRAERNRGFRALLDFVQANPALGWEVDKQHTTTVPRRVWHVLDGAGNFVSAHNTQAAAQQAVGPGEHAEPALENRETYDLWAEREEDVHGWIDGGRRRINIPDPLFRAAVKNMGHADMNNAVRTLGRFSRYYSRINTALSPVFVFRNLVRDLQAAGLSAFAEQGPDIARDTLKGVPGAIGAMWRQAKNRGLQAAPGSIDHYAQEFRANGGPAGYYNLGNALEQAEQLEARLQRAGPGHWQAALRFRDTLANLVTDVNGAVENGTRLAAYAAMRRRGASIEKAVAMAKNLTVNFQRRGELGPVLNAFYAFYNPNVQGTKRLLEVLRSPRGAQLAAGLFALGVALDLMNRAAAGDDDDDGQNDYDQIPEFVKERNLIIPTGKRPLLIPLPYGFNVLLGLGRNSIATILGAKPVSEAIANSASGAFSAFNPLGSEGTFLQLLAPTALDPLAQIAENRTWSGAPLMPESFPGDKRPDAERYFRTVSPVAKGMAKWLNEHTGGSRYRSGWIDVSPETIELLSDFAFGAAGKFAHQAVEDVGGAVVRGEAPPIRKTPFLSSFVYQEHPSQHAARYVEISDELDRLESEYEAAVKARDGGTARRVTTSPLWRARSELRAIDKRVNALQREMKTRGQRGIGVSQLETQVETLRRQASRAATRAGWR